MNFKDFDKKMRLYEMSLDQYVTPDTNIVVRLDGRNFSNLTEREFQKPFDASFHEMMKTITESAMQAGFRIIYGYTQSDEISLLFHPEENGFGRKTRKINSTLAGVASAIATLYLNNINTHSEEKIIATFDSRVVPLPNKDTVIDYFAWRQEDARRNALNAYCYWLMRQNGKSKGEAASVLKHKGNTEKMTLLSEAFNIDWADTEKVPIWQYNGTAFYYQNKEINGYNPVTGETVKTMRNVLSENEALKCGEGYRMFLAETLNIK